MLTGLVLGITKNNKIDESNQELDDIKRLAGIGKSKNHFKHYENISYTAMEKVRLMKEHNIKPGTPEWFKLWFSLPLWFKESQDR
jgi:hypothetical protein